MDFTLPQQTVSVVDELTTWAANQPRYHVTPDDDARSWAQLCEFGLFDLESHGGTLLDLACGVMALARAPMPGPVVEAQLAVAANPDAASRVLIGGGVVTSVAPSGRSRVMVGWGAAAELVIDQADGTILAQRPLPLVANAYGLPHGWYEHPGPDERGRNDPHQARRWLLVSAASAGLAAGALDAATRHAKDRELFGRTLSSFQAVQLRLAESVHLLEGSERLVRDAGWRLCAGKPHAVVSAALAWIFTARAAAIICKHAHQVFGALGFATETGLYRYSSQALWLRLSTPPKRAARFVMARRAMLPGPPPSLVLAGFRD